MPAENTRTILLRNDAPGGGDIVSEGGLRLLNDADMVAVLDKNVINASPARTIRPGTVYQNNIPDAMLFAQRWERATGPQQ